MNPLIDIQRMRISLPHFWRGKERLFAQTVAAELGKLPMSQSVSVDRLQLPEITVQPGESYTFVARRVARQIHGQIQSAASGGDSSLSATSVQSQQAPALSQTTSMKGGPNHA